MIESVRLTAALLLGVGVLMVGNGLLASLLGLSLAEAGTNTLVIGLVMACYFAGLVLGCVYAGALIMRVGHIRAFAVYAAVTSAATLLHGFAFSPWAWASLRLLVGFAMAGLFMCTESWLNARASNDTRGRMLSLYMVTVYLAQAAGQGLLVIEDDSGFVRLAIASVAISLGLVPVASTRMPQPVLPAPEPFGAKELYRASPLGMIGATASGLILGAFYALGPAFTHGVGANATGTALFMSAAIAGGVALQWPIGRMSDFIERRAVVIGVSIGIAVASVAIFLFAVHLQPWVWVPAVLFGGAAFTLYPLSVAQANDHLAPSQLVAASGSLLIAYGIGAAIGPVAAAGVSLTVGPPGLFAFIAISALVVAAVAVWRRSKSPPVPIGDRVPYAALPRTTPTVSELDPRGEPTPG